MPTYTPVTTNVKADWREDSACSAAVEENPIIVSAWDDENSPMRTIADSICESCPVRMICLVDAIEDENSFGNRGGFFFDRGAVSTREHRNLGRNLGLQARKRQKTRVYASSLIEQDDFATVSA